MVLLYIYWYCIIIIIYQLQDTPTSGPPFCRPDMLRPDMISFYIISSSHKDAWWPLLHFYQRVSVFYCGIQNWTQCFRFCLTGADTISSLNLLN